MPETIYQLIIPASVDKELNKLAKKDRKLHHKIEVMLAELKTNPKGGTGRPERLKGHGADEYYSKRVTPKDRLVYEICDYEGVPSIWVYSITGHYDDH